MTVVDIEDYRGPRTQGAPCTITFLGARFKYSEPDGRDGSLNVTLTVLNGDYQSVINAIKEQGGAFYPDPNDSGTYWLLPWPPAAIRISHEPSANQLAYAEIGHEVSINENVPRQTEELSK
jgi:hypothetical protein